MEDRRADVPDRKMSFADGKSPPECPDIAASRPLHNISRGHRGAMAADAAGAGCAGRDKGRDLDLYHQIE